MYFIAKLFRFPLKFRNLLYLRFNRLFFTLNGVVYGKHFKVYNQIYISKHPSAQISIGDNFEFLSGEGFNPLCRNIRGSIYAPERR